MLLGLAAALLIKELQNSQAQQVQWTRYTAQLQHQHANTLKALEQEAAQTVKSIHEAHQMQRQEEAQPRPFTNQTAFGLLTRVA